MMKKLILVLLTALPLYAAVQDREAEQARLDAGCESAKTKLVSEGKQQRVDNCEKEGKRKGECEQAFAEFGQREGNKRPDFSTLPACQQAEQYRKSYRQ